MPADGRSIAIRSDPRNPVPDPVALDASLMPAHRARRGRPGQPPWMPVRYHPSFRLNPAARDASLLRNAIANALQQYERDDNLGRLLDALRSAAASAGADALVAAAEPYRERLEVIVPLYERVVELRPNDARALVTLANAYWLTGRGPEVVGALAVRARSADPDNRGAWHLWALAEPGVRQRVERWAEVSRRFPQDQLARAALADNAASLAGAEHDPVALGLAIATYEELLSQSVSPAQSRALEQTLQTLRSWRL